VSSILVVVAVAVVATVVGVLWTTFGRPKPRARRADYLHALEHWLAGEEDEALRLLTEVVREDPSSVEPYLQLGNLLRRRGDAARAAVLHRGLTVRPGLPARQRVAIGLALAEDLLALERWDEAQEVLDGLMRQATGRAAFWRARFAQWHGQGNLPEAARTLKDAPRFCPERDQAWFRASYAAYQLDRALHHARAGEAGPARARLKDVAKFPSTAPRAALVRAVLAAAQQDATGALTVAAEELLDNPRELELFLPLLQDVLLESGQFSRSVPILERACQSAQAPARLWISLALLYEKLGEREKAVRLLESKAGSGRLTPDEASPYLRHLAREDANTDLGKVCSLLSTPTMARVWTCADCGRTTAHIHWFCPACRGFDTYRSCPEAT